MYFFSTNCSKVNVSKKSGLTTKFEGATKPDNFSRATLSAEAIMVSLTTNTEMVARVIPSKYVASFDDLSRALIIKRSLIEWC